MTKADRPNTGREGITPADWTPVAAPRGDLPAALAGTERPEHILRALRDLEQAMAIHDQWLTDWHAHLLSRFDPGNRQEGPPPPYPEATWFQNSHCASFLKDNPTFRTVGPALASIRRRADRLVAAVDRTGTVSVANYSRLMSAVTEFSKVVRHLHNDAWNRLANIDPLTGLGNRPAMLRRLTIECERRARNLQPCCVAVLDLDFFKNVNDSYGHSAGDTVLRSVASLLAASVRPYDAVFRYGGEEFVLCLPNADARTAWAVVERLRRKVASWSIPIKNDTRVRVTMSIGVAPLTPERGVETALEDADAALYAAKRNGRNGICVRCA